MLPYVAQPTFQVLGIVVSAWDIAVAVGIVVGIEVVYRRVGQYRLDGDVIRRMTIPVVLGSFVVAHLFDLFFYHPEKLQKGLGALLKFWSGLSSIGGFVGGVTVVCWYAYRHRLPLLAYGDAIMFGFVPAWIFGRLGCTLAHDHPGKQTDFFLGFDHFPDGAVRHDLGFYELLLFLGIGIVFFLVRHRALKVGWYVGFVGLSFSVFRFWCDFLRMESGQKLYNDPRYGGLTPAQYFAIPLALVSLWILIRPAREVLAPRSGLESTATENGAGSPGK
jgi:phosphatidylglycerol---prolipoprotein diacylglyceryl transferase